MAIHCFGSINIDLFYQLSHEPAAGETLAALDHSSGLGGKGANQSVAARRAGAIVHHWGAVGRDGQAVLKLMRDYGVDMTGVIQRDDLATGHAIIMLTPDGENRIILHSGANQDLPRDLIERLGASISAGDTLLLQNETSSQVEAAQVARECGAQVIYSAAPFDVSALKDVLSYVDVLALNEIEARQATEALGTDISGLPVREVVITRGASSVEWRDCRSDTVIEQPVPKVDPIDTTGAGDTFIGYFAAACDLGEPVEGALDVAVHAAALKVTRRGTAEAIPDRSEVEAFRRLVR